MSVAAKEEPDLGFAERGFDWRAWRERAVAELGAALGSFGSDYALGSFGCDHELDCAIAPAHDPTVTASLTRDPKTGAVTVRFTLTGEIVVWEHDGRRSSWGDRIKLYARVVASIPRDEAGHPPSLETLGGSPEGDE